jgi:hypothetical protein
MRPAAPHIAANALGFRRLTVVHVIVALLAVPGLLFGAWDVYARRGLRASLLSFTEMSL